MDIDAAQAQAIATDLHTAITQAGPVLASAATLLANLNKSYDPAQVSKILGDAETSFAQLSQVIGRLNNIAASLEETAANLQTFSAKLK
jgi:DNA repair ATPase RecN